MGGIADIPPMIFQDGGEVSLPSLGGVRGKYRSNPPHIDQIDMGGMEILGGKRRRRKF